MDLGTGLARVGESSVVCRHRHWNLGYSRLATVNKLHEAKSVECGDCETSRGVQAWRNGQEDFGEVRKEAWRRPGQGRQTNDLKSG